MHNIVYNGRDPVDAATFTKVYIYDYKKEKYERSLYKKMQILQDTLQLLISQSKRQQRKHSRTNMFIRPFLKHNNNYNIPISVQLWWQSDWAVHYTYIKFW